MNEQVRAKKSLGQHWLHDLSALKAMCDAVDVGSDDNVLEIGPGLGTLTAHLVNRAKSVIAVEFDEQLARQLPERVKASNLTVINEDILTFNLSQLSKNYKVVANIPYYLTSALIRLLSESVNPPGACALLVQKEVAQRAAAQPGQMSLLSVSAQYYWQVGLGRIVEADLFSPPPKVDSQILILERRMTPLFNGVDSRIFFSIVKSGFSSRRKTLLNSLSGGLGIDKTKVKQLLDSASIQPSLRPQALSLDDWHELYKVYRA